MGELKIICKRCNCGVNDFDAYSYTGDNGLAALYCVDCYSVLAGEPNEIYFKAIADGTIPETADNIRDEVYESSVTIKVKKCTCGSESVGSSRHSNWCDMLMEPPLTIHSPSGGWTGESLKPSRHNRDPVKCPDCGSRKVKEHNGKAYECYKCSYWEPSLYPQPW